MGWIYSLYEDLKARRQKRTEINQTEVVLRQEMDKAQLAIEHPPRYETPPTGAQGNVTDIPRLAYTDKDGEYWQTAGKVETDKLREDLAQEVLDRIADVDEEETRATAEETRLQNEKQNKIGTVSITGKVSGTVASIADNHVNQNVTINTTSTNLVTDDIPNLPASKITSGTFAIARIPQLEISKINNLQNTINDLQDRINELQTQINDLSCCDGEDGGGSGNGGGTPGDGLTLNQVLAATNALYVKKSGDIMTGRLEIKPEGYSTGSDGPFVNPLSMSYYVENPNPGLPYDAPTGGFHFLSIRTLRGTEIWDCTQIRFSSYMEPFQAGVAKGDFKLSFEYQPNRQKYQVVLSCYDSNISDWGHEVVLLES